jgi:hypothetical protein
MLDCRSSRAPIEREGDVEHTGIELLLAHNAEPGLVACSGGDAGSSGDTFYLDVNLNFWLHVRSLVGSRENSTDRQLNDGLVGPRMVVLGLDRVGRRVGPRCSAIRSTGTEIEQHRLSAGDVILKK